MFCHLSFLSPTKQRWGLGARNPRASIQLSLFVALRDLPFLNIGNWSNCHKEIFLLTCQLQTVKLTYCLNIEMNEFGNIRFRLKGPFPRVILGSGNVCSTSKINF